MSVNVSARLRIAPALLIGGAVVLAIGTFLHPSSADPNVPELAFAEYAADGLWIYSHLLQLAGIGAMFLGLVLLGQGLSKPLDAMVAVLAAINIALAAALQAVDGVALKHMVDLWARSEGPARDIAFGAAYAVRQIEIGLASMFSLVGGATTIFLALVLSAGGQFPRWTACLGGAAGAATVLAGLIMARSGFSPLEMTVAMPAGLLLLAWAIALGVIGWRGV